MARGAKNARQEDRFLNEIISLFILNARKSKNALNAKIIEVIPNEISIAFKLIKIIINIHTSIITKI